MATDLKSLTEFSASASALGLTDREKELAFALLAKAGVGLNDPTSLNYVAIVKMESVVHELSENFVTDGKALIARLKKVIGEELQAQLATVPAQVTKSIDSTLNTAVRELVSNVDLAVTKEAQRRQSFRMGGYALGAAVLTIVAAVGGYAVGKDAINAQAAKWEALVTLPTGSTWLSLARWNDIDKAMSQSCGPSEGAVISGAKVCDLRLFVAQPVSTSKGTDYVKLSAAEYAVKLGWLGYGLAAVMGGIVVGLWGRLRRT